MENFLFKADYYDGMDDDVGPCGRWRPGDADLNTFDLIREFQLDNREINYEGLSLVQGSNVLQTAYRLERESNLTMLANDAFPKGVPHQFSFECTFRMRRPQQQSWYLFHLTDSYEKSQMSVVINPRRETLELALPDVNGDIQTVAFRHAMVSDFIILGQYKSLNFNYLISYSINRGTK